VFESRWAETASLVLLVIAIFFLTFYGGMHVNKTQLRQFCYFVIVVFEVELVLKLWAFGFRGFFARGVNMLDFVVVSAAFFATMAHLCARPSSYLGKSENLANLGLLFLAMRGVRLFPKVELLTKFSSTTQVLPHFLSAAAVCFLLLYSWAVVGMEIFAGRGPGGSVVAAVDNFDSFWCAGVSMFEVATTYDWHAIMYTWMGLLDSW
jgi:hypothetical protein